MKNRYYTPVLASFLLFLFSCDNLLDTTPEISIPDGSIIVDKKSADAVLIGVYDAIQSAEATGVVAWNNAADNVVGFSSQSVIIPTLQAAGTTAFDPTSGGGYNSYYVAINRANTIIKNVPEVVNDQFSQKDRESILGQAYFLRALAYFDLARTYGGVPLVLNPSTTPETQTGIKKSSKEAVLGQVLNDLDQAENLLPDAFSSRNKASRPAVYGLKARLFLYTGEWNQAEEYASLLIENSSIELTDQVSDFFTTKQSNESIFELTFSSSDKNPFYTYYLSSSEGGRLDYIPNPSFVEELIDPAKGGLRKQLIKERTDGVWVIRQYDKQDGSSSIFILRLAEQYLIRAEARLKKTPADKDGAAADLNEIKDRAEVSLLDIPTILGVDDLLLEVEKERRLELAFEGHRYSDVIRTGRAEALFGGYNPRYKDTRYWVFPFPYSAVSADPDLDQNDGY